MCSGLERRHFSEAFRCSPVVARLTAHKATCALHPPPLPSPRLPTPPRLPQPPRTNGATACSTQSPLGGMAEPRSDGLLHLPALTKRLLS
ncbi:unnamed protein product [Protopolystoma xenopodis]|uniref:Uncharacterized protein n=1 Tax=Protopolystoma xenopodis TaxID=117903 RepID=A0A448XT15_9PLAT|nr:unnamed protein product [Protopolystoma xenopodis]